MASVAVLELIIQLETHARVDIQATVSNLLHAIAAPTGIDNLQLAGSFPDAHGLAVVGADRALVVVDQQHLFGWDFPGSASRSNDVWSRL
jgi:hypothetical protein